MSDSPVPTPRQNESEILTKSPDIQTSTSIVDTSIVEKDDLPILVKADDRTSSITSHVDENNENDAVCELTND
jgi:hypothetical protein